jgi:hypothetical protein
VTVVILVVIVTIVVALFEDAGCHRSKEKPDMDSIQVKNFASADKTMLANLAGYMQMADNTYLSLDIESVSIGRPDENGAMTVTYVAKCFSFQVKIKKHDNLYVYLKAEMFVNDKQYKPKKICDFFSRLSSEFSESEYYSCKEVKSHQCLTDYGKTLVANLVLKSFELEYEGTPAKVADRIFDKRAWTASCAVWFYG